MQKFCTAKMLSSSAYEFSDRLGSFYILHVILKVSSFSIELSELNNFTFSSIMLSISTMSFGIIPLISLLTSLSWKIVDLLSRWVMDTISVCLTWFTFFEFVLASLIYLNASSLSANVVDFYVLVSISYLNTFLSSAKLTARQSYLLSLALYISSLLSL